MDSGGAGTAWRPPGVVQPSVRLATRPPCSMPISWAIMPPMEMPKTWARGISRASSRPTASLANDAIE